MCYLFTYEASEILTEDRPHVAVTLPDGGQRDGVAGVTTPFDIAQNISKQLAKKILVAR